MNKKNKFLYTDNFFRIVLAVAPIMYLLFGFLFNNLLKIEDLFPMEHRLIASLFFLLPLLFSFFSSWFKKNLNTITFILAYLAVAQLIYVSYSKNYSLTLAISLIAVIAIVNLFSKAYNYVLYLNIILVIFVFVSLWSTDKSLTIKFYYSLLYFITASFSYLTSFQKYLNEKELKLNKERMELAIKAANFGVWDWNIKTDKVVYNNNWAEMLGYSLSELENMLDTWEEKIHPKDREGVEEKLSAHLKGETELYESEHRLKTKSGQWKWIRDLGKVVERDQDGEPLRALGIHLDIEEQKEAEKEIKYLSFHDELTGLYNRRYLNQKLKKLSYSNKRPVSIIIGDLDKLKIVNDNYGHLLGDEYLQEAASILKSVIRTDDIVARTGGDEFSIILPETSNDDAQKICERIREKFKEVNQMEELPVKFSISLGLATSEKREEDLNNCYNKADKEMYKNKGRKQCD